MPNHRLSLANTLEASQIIDPVFLHSPQYRAESLEGKKVGVIFCGSNLTPLQMGAWLPA